MEFFFPAAPYIPLEAQGPFLLAIEEWQLHEYWYRHLRHQEGMTVARFIRVLATAIKYQLDPGGRMKDYRVVQAKANALERYYYLFCTVAARYFGDDQLTVATLVPQALEPNRKPRVPLLGPLR